MELYIAFGILIGIAVSAGVAVICDDYAFIGEITWAQTLSKRLAIRSYS
jgi:hypothetical protein